MTQGAQICSGHEQSDLARPLHRSQKRLIDCRQRSHELCRARELLPAFRRERPITADECRQGFRRVLSLRRSPPQLVNGELRLPAQALCCSVLAPDPPATREVANRTGIPDIEPEEFTRDDMNSERGGPILLYGDEYDLAAVFAGNREARRLDKVQVVPLVHLDDPPPPRCAGESRSCAYSFQHQLRHPREIPGGSRGDGPSAFGRPLSLAWHRPATIIIQPNVFAICLRMRWLTALSCPSNSDHPLADGFVADPRHDAADVAQHRLDRSAFGVAAREGPRRPRPPRCTSSARLQTGGRAACCRCAPAHRRGAGTSDAQLRSRAARH